MLYPEHEEQYGALFTSDDPTGFKRRKVIDDAYLHRIQRKHFLLFDVLPLFGTLLAIGLLPLYPIGAAEVGVAVALWILTGFGISVGYHRLFAHATFKTHPWVAAALAIFGAMAGQGALISWVAMHRRHHEFSDREGDMHSPNLSGSGFKGKLRGFVHAHFTWMMAHPYPNVVHYAPDLLRNHTLMFISRHYYAWILLGFALPAALCGIVTLSWSGVLTGFLWGGFVRMFVLEHGIWSLNSICHLTGTRRFKTRDQSRNNAWLAPFTFGEAWHHNHHAFLYSASFGLSWYRIDPGYWLIRLLATLGLASEIKVPDPGQVQARLATSGG
ncbi:fatty acid desaturase [Aquabacterium sp. A7-Y]|uniref:acyl-CoA desaturase n=1 Tax=Aquabacterium sp. A7-Y TaxID=1349605 RepID=UPI00223C8D97|nr:fatty acid desaturase [Aquabacterium sp. A7-Y]MCW7541679.1 fatty acid desaturase [Aquabacterium sp. A7-Y]